MSDTPTGFDRAPDRYTAHGRELSDYEQGRLDYEQGRSRGFGWAHLTDTRRTEHDRGFCDARRRSA